MVNEYNEQFDKAVAHLKSEISGLRTGRATPALVEDLMVEAYGTKQQLKAVASISVADAKTIQVQAWDKSVLADIELAIRNSHLGVNPVNDGELIRVILPELTTERRAELIKVLHQKLEQARVAVRKIREDARNKVEKAEKEKEISEDEKYKWQDVIEKMVKEYNEQIKKVGEEKEKEINTV